jgi:hypothetical protein
MKTTLTVHKETQPDGYKIVEIPAVLRIEVPANTSDQDILKLAFACESDCSATIEDSLDNIKEHLKGELPEETISKVKFSDVWVSPLRTDVDIVHK